MTVLMTQMIFYNKNAFCVLFVNDYIFNEIECRSDTINNLGRNLEVNAGATAHVIAYHRIGG